MEDFKVIMSDSDEVLLATSVSEDVIDNDKMEKIEKRILSSAIKDYEDIYRKGLYSSFLDNQAASVQHPTIDFVNNLANDPQNDLNKVKQINALVKQYVNKDDIIGKVYESIQNYVSTDYTIDAPNNIPQNTSEDNTIDIQNIINDFNNKVNLDRLLRNGIPMSYLEGTYILYLRNDDNGNYVIDKYPLGICEVTEYMYNGEPIIAFNIDELKRKLKPSSRKKKNGKNLFFNDMSEIIKNNYPSEIVDAYNNKEKWVALNPKRVGLIRVNNLDELYGLSPVFKALKPALMLETIEKADENTIKAKSKKIIHQGLRKELGGSEGNRKAFAEATHAHKELANAFRQDTVLYTSQHWVDFVKYVEPSVETTDEKTLNFYRSKVFTALGVSFLDSYNSSINVCNIAIEALMKMINAIGEQFEGVINKFYKVIMEDKGLNPELSPTIRILDSEVLNFEMRKSLSEFMYTKLNCSIKKAYEIMGIANVESELKQREFEDKNGWNNVFTPHESFYTQSNRKKESGRPKGDKSDKQDYDSERNKLF